MFTRLLSLLFVFLISCNHQKVHRINVKENYETSQPYYMWKHSLFHIHADTIQLHVQIPLQSLLYKRNSVNNPFYSHFSIRCELYESFKDKIVIDSSSIEFFDSLYYGHRFVQHLDVSLPWGNTSGVVKIIMKDNNRNQQTTFIQPFNGKELGNRQFYYAVKKGHGRMIGNVCSVYDTLHLQLSPLIEADSLHVYYFHLFYDIAAPPFDQSNTLPLFSWKPDSIFSVPVFNGRTQDFQLTKKGVYHFMTDTLVRNGFTVFVNRVDFPRITSHVQMVGPVRYVSSHKEFRQLEKNPDVRGAVDNFWLDVSLNAGNAAQQIQDYYSRVQFANMLFTSYKEGWMTDRGMVYVVIGTPTVVHQTQFSEVWIYGEEKNMSSTSFEFRKVFNPLSDKDYVLTRSLGYKELWHRSVKMWRR
jgi:GWxTD domain-containing protein